VKGKFNNQKEEGKDQKENEEIKNKI